MRSPIIDRDQPACPSWPQRTPAPQPAETAKASPVVLAGGASLIWIDQADRDDGFVVLPSTTAETAQYALVTDNLRLEGAGLQWAVDHVIGDVRVRSVPIEHGAALFLGVARTEDALEYLRGVGYAQLAPVGARVTGGLAGLFGSWTTTSHRGAQPPIPPIDADIWVASTAGGDAPSVQWRPSAGDWTLVVMRVDGEQGVSARIQIGAALPGLIWLAGMLVGLGAILLATGGLLIGLASRRAQRAADGAVGVHDPPGESRPKAADTDQPQT